MLQRPTSVPFAFSNLRLGTAHFFFVFWNKITERSSELFKQIVHVFNIVYLRGAPRIIQHSPCSYAKVAKLNELLFQKYFKKAWEYMLAYLESNCAGNN